VPQGVRIVLKAKSIFLCQHLDFRAPYIESVLPVDILVSQIHIKSHPIGPWLKFTSQRLLLVTFIALLFGELLAQTFFGVTGVDIEGKID